MVSPLKALSEEISGILIADGWKQAAAEKRRADRLEAALRKIAEPSSYPLSPDAHKLKTLAQEALDGREV